MRVDVVDPPAYTPPYDRALSAALARAGASVRLVTSEFGYGAVAPAVGYAVDERFYRRAGRVGGPGSRARRLARLAEHAPDMLAYARRAAPAADVVHWQWLTLPQLDGALLPRGRPQVLTAHDVLPREPRPGQLAAARRLLRRFDAVVVHSEHGRERLAADVGVDESRLHVIPHGAFSDLAAVPPSRPLPADLAESELPVVLLFGLVRPYKGLDVLLDAWPHVDGAELWVVGRPRMDLAPLKARAPATVRFVERFIGDDELGAYFDRADLVVLPYREIDQSGVLATALGFGKPLVLSDVGGFPEVAAHGAAELVPAGDAAALGATLQRLLGDAEARGRLAAASRAAGAPGGPYDWDAIARRHLELYGTLVG